MRTPQVNDAAGILAAAFAVAGVVMIVRGLGHPGPPPGPPAAIVGPSVSRAADAPLPAVSARALVSALEGSVPVRLDIPAIGVHTGVVALGLNQDGTIAVPQPGRHAPAGWYRYLPTPGETGPAVILGHVDSDREGPAVFYRLGDLRAGDTVSVGRVDGSTVSFTVVTVAQYPKTAFPAQAVYGHVDYPALRMITCGGDFDRSRHSYRDNVVVYARLKDSRPHVAAR